MSEAILDRSPPLIVSCLLASGALVAPGVLPVVLLLLIITWAHSKRGVGAPDETGSAPLLSLQSSADRDWPWIGVALLAMITVWTALAAPIPHDDLLRHIHAWRWNYDYTRAYEHHTLSTHWSPWIGFDWIVGNLGRYTTPLAATRLVRAVEVGVFGVVVWRACTKLGSSTAVSTACFTAIVAGLMFSRAMLGRPEFVLASLPFAALAMSRRAWLAYFMLLASLHWLSPLYAICAMLCGSPDERLRTRLVTNALLAGFAVVCAIALWVVLSKGALLEAVQVLRQVVGGSPDAKFTVGELQPMAQALTRPGFLGITVACAYGIHVFWHRATVGARRQTLLILGLATIFSIPDYLRYSGLVWSLMLLATAALAPREFASRSVRAVACAATLFLLYVGQSTADPEAQATFESMHVGPGDSRTAKPHILAPLTKSAFLAIGANPGALVTPIFDVNAVSAEALPTVLALTRGELHCSDTSLRQWDVVIEDTLRNAPPCLRLLRITPAARIWAVNR